MKKDILKHKLVPEHTILSKSEINKVIKKIDISSRTAPQRLKQDDPVV